VRELLLRMLVRRPPPSITVTGVTSAHASHQRAASSGPAKPRTTKIADRTQTEPPTPEKAPIIARAPAAIAMAIIPTTTPKRIGTPKATKVIPITRRKLAADVE